MGVRENIERVRASIAEAASKAGRNPGDVRLVAVSKFHPASAVLEAVAAGQTLFGENRVQEAAAKFDEVRAGGVDADLHIIGSLQRNKVKEAVRVASCIESLDRIELADEMEKQCAKIGKTVDALLEVHTGEESKSGFRSEDEVRGMLSAFDSGRYPHVVPRGFMTMAPNTDDESLVRASFSSLRLLRDRMASEFPSLPLSELSMGMSGDYGIAIEEGATIVRIGTAIFGERDYSK